MRKKVNIKWIIASLLLMCASVIMIHAFYSYHFVEQQNEEKILDFFQTSSEESKEETPIKQTKHIEENYIAVIEIPSIHLKRGLVNPNSSKNHIQYNIQIIQPSNMPNVSKGVFILASHNGNSAVSFFRYLSELTIGDVIYVYYQGYQYIYRFDNQYDIEKNGQAEIIRDNNQTTIVLITCKNNNKTKQEVYIGYLLDVQKYD